MVNLMFRKEAIEAKYKKWSPQALLLSGVRKRYVIFFTLCFFIIFFCLITLGTYTRRINVSGEIISSPRAITVLSVGRGFVINQFVHEGESIKKGQPLYRIDVGLTTTSGVVSQKRRESLENQIKTLNAISEKIQENKSITLKMLVKERVRYEQAHQHSLEILDQAGEGLRLMRDNMNNYRRYLKQGLITQDQLISQTALYYQQQNNILGLRSQNEQNALQVLTLQSELQIKAADFDNQLNQIEIQKSSIKGELIAADADGDLMVTSPIDGRVDTLSVTPGQMVSVGDSLLQIMPGKTEAYELILWVPDPAVPYLSPGQGVNIRYNAFPSEKFGQFPGKILSIAHMPASLQEMATYPSAPPQAALAPKTWYKVIVAPDNIHFSYKGRQVSAGNGMKATTTLFLEERRLYQWIFSPLYDIHDSAVGSTHGK